MPTKPITRETVIEMMKERQGGRTITALAAEFGVSKAYISDVYNGRRDPGPSILTPLGLESKEVISKIA